MQQETNCFDLVVLGSGAAGLTTALVAAAEGLKVLVLEKTKWIGGTSAFSAGAPWIPGNPFIQGHENEPAQNDRGPAEIYLRAVLGNEFDAPRSLAYIESARPMFDYVGRHGVTFLGVMQPDYFPDAPGSRVGRAVIAADLDGRTMDPALLKRIRRSFPAHTLFGGMQIGGLDIFMLRNAFRMRSAFLYTVKLVLRYIADLLIHGRTTRLVGGRALVARLLTAADRLGVTVWTEAETQSLQYDKGAVTGLVVRHGAETKALRTKRGVVMATGGFGANKEMRERLVQNGAAGWSVAPEGNTGDGITLGQTVGGQMKDKNHTNALNTPVSAIKRNDGSYYVFPHLGQDRAMPGYICVGPNGKRFVNEGLDYQKFVRAMHDNNFSKAFIVGDCEARDRYGIGMVKPWPFPVGHHIASGYLKMGKTIEALAQVIGVEPTALSETMDVFNRHAKEGRDPEFGRDTAVYSRYAGDHTRAPATSVAPLSKPPFYAVELRPGDLCTFAGLDTDENGRALDANGKAIPGLYAVGLDMNPVARGHYPAGGFGLGPGMIFGYRAAMHAAHAEKPAAE